MYVKLITVGRLKKAFAIEGAAFYEDRLRHHCRFERIEIPEEKVPPKSTPSDAEIQRLLEKEGARISPHLEKSATRVILDRQGREFDSPELARYLAAAMARGTVAFVIGGALGISDGIVRGADLRLSFSRMTFPHDLFQVMFLEQLYRAFTIHAGHPYHK